jgi:hypothetical protein
MFSLDDVICLTLALHRVIFFHFLCHAYVNTGTLKRVHFISWLCISIIFFSLDHLQSSHPTFSGFDWPLPCICTLIISYPYSAHLDPEDGDSVFIHSWYPCTLLHGITNPQTIHE